MFCCAAGDQGQPVEVLDDEVKGIAEPTAEPSAVPATEVEQPAPEPEEVVPKGKTVHALVVGATGIRNADWAPGAGKSDAFVTVDFVGGSGGFKTPVINDSLQPVWNHEGELLHVPDGAAIDFTVWDQDAVSKELLGKVRVQPVQYEAHGFNGELLLSEAGKGIKAYLKVKVKVAGKEYPAGQGATFSVTLDKPSDASLGLDVDVLGGTALHICGIKPGVIESYNAAHNSTPELHLSTGFYILEVNGISGNASEMISRLREDSQIKLLLRRPQLFPIAITKKGGTLGLDLNYAATGVALLILKINDGPVSEWNAIHKDLEVKKGDRIVSVNGVSGSTKELYDALKSADQLQLTISRPAPDAWWGVH